MTMTTSGSDDRKIAPKSKGWLGRVGHTPRSERVNVGVERAWKRVTWADHEENQTLCQGLAPIVLVDRFHRSVPDPDMDTDTEAHTPIVVPTAARRCTADLMVQASNHLQTGPDDDPTISPYGCACRTPCGVLLPVEQRAGFVIVDAEYSDDGIFGRYALRRS
jgi:hypothetical protein